MPIGPYVADFVCVEAKLIVELDGPSHHNAVEQSRDLNRDAWLARQGWRVLRFPNELVLGDGDLVVEQIMQSLA